MRNKQKEEGVKVIRILLCPKKGKDLLLPLWTKMTLGNLVPFAKRYESRV